MYKWTTEEETQLLRESDGALIPIDERNNDYGKFLESGETPKPWKTENELKKIKKEKDEKDRKDKFDADVKALLDPDTFIKTMSRAIRLLRKEMHLVATPEEKAELNLLEGVDLAMDALIAEYEIDKKNIKEEK